MPTPRRMPTDRLPPRRARARPSTAGEIDDNDTGSAVVAEVDAEAFDGAVTVPIGDVDITVPRPGAWRGSASNDLRIGDFGSWAAKTLSQDDFEAWTDADPTVDEINEFFAEWGRLSGVSLGGSPASPASSRNTVRRSKRT